MTDTEFVQLIHEHLAVHEGGGPAISIGWDDATRDYIITQHYSNNRTKWGYGQDLFEAMRKFHKSVVR